MTTVVQRSSRASRAGPGGRGSRSTRAASARRRTSLAGLVDAAVAAEQVQHLGERVVIVQVGVEQLEQPGVGRVGRPAGQQGRQRRDALAKISSRRLAGLVAGDVDDVVAELEDHPDLLAEVRHHSLQLRSRPGDLGAEQRRGRDQGAGLVGDDLAGSGRADLRRRGRRFRRSDPARAGRRFAPGAARTPDRGRQTMSDARANSRSPTRIATVFPQREFALSEPRRIRASSMTSS